MKTARSPAPRTGYPGPSWQSSGWSGTSAHPNVLHRIRRGALRRRRLVAALLLCLAAAVAVQQLTPASPPTRAVLVAARDLPAGHFLSAADLAPEAVAPGMVPDGALLQTNTAPKESLPGETLQGETLQGEFFQGEWLGRQLSGPVRRGEVLTDASFLGAELLVGSPPGTQAVPLRVSDPATLKLLRQGQLVSVVLSRSETLDGPVRNEVLAAAVPVLWTPELAQADGGLLPAQEVEGMVVVAASAGQALQLAGAGTQGKVFLILVPD